MNLNFTGRLRFNAGTLEQEQIDGYGVTAWHEVPDVLPRRDELPSAISHAALQTALASGEAPRVRLDGGREAARGKTIEDRVAAIERRYLPLVRIDDATGAAKIVGVSRADGTGPYYQIERAALSRMPDMLRDNGKADLPSEATPDRLTYETIAEILRSHSSPTMGAPGSVHGGQQGFIVYETDGLPFVVSRLAELATLDDGRTAKDMLCEQGSEIDRLKKLADYQAEEITRLEDTARLGLRDDAPPARRSRP